MWRPVTKNGEKLGLVANNVGELKKILDNIPDDYMLSVTGITAGVLADDEDKVILLDEVKFLEELLCEQEER